MSLAIGVTNADETSLVIHLVKKVAQIDQSYMYFRTLTVIFYFRMQM